MIHPLGNLQYLSRICRLPVPITLKDQFQDDRGPIGRSFLAEQALEAEAAASSTFESGERLAFCRVTALGFLRLLHQRFGYGWPLPKVFRHTSNRR